MANMDYYSSKSKTPISYCVMIPSGEDAGCSSPNKELMPDTFTGPVEKRRRTNVGFLFFFGIFLTVWFLLSFYCMAYGDLDRLHMSQSSRNRFTTRQDSQNNFISYRDYSQNSASYDPDSQNNFISYISDDSQNSARYDPDDPLKNLAKSLKFYGGEIYLSCTCAIGFSTLLIILFRHYAGVIVWLVVGLVISVFVTITLGLWSLWFHEKATADDHSPTAESSSTFLGAIVATIITLVASLVIYALRKNIRMVIILFKEGGKVAQAIPLILVQPFVTLVALIVCGSIGVYFFLIIESSGFETVNHLTNETTYQKDELMMFARIYNIVTLCWIVQFLIGCQHMVIAGAVATWFFSRDKSHVKNALTKSYRYLYKFHLGSVALGSLIITTIKILRFIHKMMSKRNSCIFCLVKWLCKYLERFVTFLTRNAYIEIAIYGDGFWVSGKRAFHALTNNAVKVATLNSVGDFVLVLGRTVIIACSILVGKLLIQSKSGVDTTLPLVLIGIFAWIVSGAFLAAFEMIVDSLFICFCEDCDINDGVTRPYYMSKELMVFINKDRHKVLRVGDAAVD